MELRCVVASKKNLFADRNWNETHEKREDPRYRYHVVLTKMRRDWQSVLLLSHLLDSFNAYHPLDSFIDQRVKMVKQVSTTLLISAEDEV